jgi:ubiquinone biosynthesis protein Coq4
MLLAFSQAQTPQRGYRALLSMAVAQANIDLGFQRALLRAYRAGRQAAPLIFVRWEQLLERPLDELRRELRVETIAW